MPRTRVSALAGAAAEEALEEPASEEAAALLEAEPPQPVRAAPTVMVRASKSARCFFMIFLPLFSDVLWKSHMHLWKSHMHLMLLLQWIFLVCANNSAGLRGV